MVKGRVPVLVGIAATWVSASAPAWCGAEEDRFASFNANPVLVAPTEPLPPAEQLKKFRLPPGFAIELVASEPDIQKPMNLNFDAQGRLYVTHSIEYPYPVAAGTPGRDAVSVFADTDGDGKYDRRTTLADGLNIPIGVAPVADAVLCYSIPTIFRLRDADGDGHAETRDPAYGEFGSRDTHGMASSFNWWIDGWVYACHGFANHSEVKGADGQVVKMHSGNTYRYRTDGSHVEQWTHGQVNPFGMSFDSLGNQFTADCHTKPAYMLLRGAWYPMFGDVHDGLGMGPELMQHLHGSTGIGGIVHYSADHFPAEYQETLFIGNPVTGRINHDRLEEHGSSYRAIEQPDFVTCDDPWFRPVDLRLGPDGALYVADFYNKIIGHYEVPLDHPARDRHRGRIWRITHSGSNLGTANKEPVRVDLTQLSVLELCDRLNDPNLTIRVLATHQLVHRVGKDAIGPVRALVQDAGTAAQKAHGLWVLERMGALDDELREGLFADSDRLVRVHATKVLAERPEWTARWRAVATGRLADSDPFVRRAAADAVGRHPDSTQLQPLLDLWARTPPDDTHLVHVVRMALRDNLLAEPSLVATSRRFAGDIDKQRRLADVTLGIRAPKAGSFLLLHLAENANDPARLGALVEHAARWIGPESLEEVVSWARGLRERGPDIEYTALRAIQRGMQARGVALDGSTRSWASDVAAARLASANDRAVIEGLELAREVRLESLAPTIAERAREPKQSAEIRIAALTALRTLGSPAAAVLIDTVAREAEPTWLRRHAAELLGSVPEEATRNRLVAVLAVAPRELAESIARGLATNDAGAEQLLVAIAAGRASPQLLRDPRVVQELKLRTVRDKEARLAELQKDLPSPDEELAKLVAKRREAFQTLAPDSGRGAKVFEKTCAKCHQLDGKGEKIGPQLDGIGARGLDRLLEDTLNPNQNVDQAFRGTIVALADGQIVQGLALREEGETLVVADGEGKLTRIPHSEIAERRLSNLSPMPGDVASKLPEGEFADLMSYLLSQRTPLAEAKAP